MKSTPRTRNLQGYLAVASREHGPDSPEAMEARRAWNAARLAHQLTEGIATHGAFTADQQTEIVAALLGGTR